MKFIASLFFLGVAASAQINNHIETFGMVGVADGQTARLNVLNQGVQAPALGLVCTVALSFVDEQGFVLKTSTVAVPPGRSAFLDLDSTADLKLATNQRQQVRAVLTQMLQGQTTACPVTPTLEIFDRQTGKTSFVMWQTTVIPQILRPSARP